METNELQNIWKNIDSEIDLKSMDELNQTLSVKTRKIINKFLLIFSIDIAVCVGLIAFLIITALNRQSDIIYQVNNSILCLITLVSLIVSLLSLRKLQNNKYNLSLKDWLEQRIKILSGWLLGRYSRLYIVLIPVLLVMINLSIHVYYENKLFMEVMKNEESIYGLLIGFLIGLFVSFFAINKIPKYQLKNLEFLKALHTYLCSNEH
jgi:membrane protein YdbS with pleckstrin-like domain